MNDVQESLLSWYEQHGRSRLPWRQTRDPYLVLVSEVMLAQTQVERVVPKYKAFVARFPDVESLARAGAADVLRMWQGLGYNSRAVRLKEFACAVLERFEGRIPAQADALRSLPGLGPYTVAAIRAFAFGCDDAAVDTNVRRVVHRVLHGIEYPRAVSPGALYAQACELVPPGRGHAWNSAMMDLGASICTARTPKCLICPLQRSCKAAPVDAMGLERARRSFAPEPPPQQRIPFEQTIRYARGRIIERLRALAPGMRISLLDLHAQAGARALRTAQDTRAIVTALERDGLVEIRGEQVALRE